MSKEHDQDYEALVEDYEDALMRLIMYRVAQEDGKRLLEEAEELERSGFEVPKELDEKCLKLIRDLPASQAHQQNREKSGPQEGVSQRHFRLRLIGRALVAAMLAAVLLFSVAYATNDNFRVGVLNFFLEIEENGTFFFFQFKESENGGIAPSGTSDSVEDFPFEFTYIPNGYELYERSILDEGANGTTYLCIYFYPNDDPNNFSLEISSIIPNMGLYIDTENADITNVTVHGHEGQRILKRHTLTDREIVRYVWFDFEQELMFYYSSIGISTDESQKIFDNIVIEDKI